MLWKYFGAACGMGIVALGILGLGGCDRNSAANAVPEGVALSIGGLSDAALERLPAGVTREDMEVGREAYATCSVCHGPDARGTALGPSLRDSVWIHVDGSANQIIQIVRSGVATPTEYPVPMPEMGGGDFNSHQLRALAEYVHALSAD